MRIFPDYNKEGKNNRYKDKEPTNLSMFFIIYFQKFWQFVGLNLLFVLTSLPIITLGPSLAATMTIARKYTKGDVVLLFDDYFKAFRANFKQSFVLGIAAILLPVMLGFAAWFYYMQGTNMWFSYIISAILFIILVLVLCMLIYAFLMIVSIDIKLKDIVRNSFVLTITEFGNVLYVVIISAFVLIISAVLLPISIILYVLLVPAFLIFLSCYWLVGMVERKVAI